MIGERRFLGLYTTTAYHASPLEIPFLRNKVKRVLERAGFPPAQPRPQGADRDPRVLPARLAVPDGQRRAVRDRDGDPRARGAPARAAVRPPRPARPVRRVPGRRSRATASTPRTANGSPRSCSRRSAAATSTGRCSCRSRCSRACSTSSTRPTGTPDDYDVAEIEARLVDATRAWTDDLRDALVDEHGEERGLKLASRYERAFPPGYRADWPARSAVADIDRIEELGGRQTGRS